MRTANRIEQYSQLMPDEGGMTMGGVKIGRAVYGAGDRTTDLTEAVQKALDQDPFMPIVAVNALAGDPAPDVGKSLKVHYKWRGKEADVEIGEEGAAVVPAIPAGGLLIRGASMKFRIIAIRWGWGLQSRDMTAAFAPFLQDPTKPYQPSVSDVSPDPAFGIHKWLVVWFDTHGRRFARLCRDDAWPITLLPPN